MVSSNEPSLYIWVDSLSQVQTKKLSVINQNGSSVSHSVDSSWFELIPLARFDLFLVVQKVGFKNYENLIFINFLVFSY